MEIVNAFTNNTHDHINDEKKFSAIQQHRKSSEKLQSISFVTRQQINASEQLATCTQAVVNIVAQYKGKTLLLAVNCKPKQCRPYPAVLYLFIDVY